jgi:glutathione S-transferase
VQRLYHREGAGRPPRVRWALEEVGATYDYVVMSKEEGRGEEHARRHPLGRVPVLETDDGLLFESAGLCLHVADSHPAAGLIPDTGTFERARVYQWTFFAMTQLEPVLVRTYLARRADDATAVEKEERRLNKAYGAIADALTGHHYLVGDRFTIADVVVGGVLDSGRRYKLLPALPQLDEYLGRLDQRPAKQRAYSD